VLEGVFHTATPFADMPSDKKNRFVLKAVHVIKGDTAKVQHGSTVVVPADRIVSLHCKSLRLGSSNGKGEAFRTDTEISLTNNDKGRDLVAAGSAWTSGATTAKVSRADGLLGDGPRKPAAGLRGNIGEWDQFRANEELFNVQAKFDENLYTTELDKSSIDSAKIKEAERLAREIEKTVSTNIHIAEERNQAIQGDYDEEDRYSGVLTEKLQVRNKDPVPPKQTMNYAAAAAKADTAKAGPPGFTAGKKGDIKIKKVVPPKEETKVGSSEESKPEVTKQEMIENTPNENKKNITEKEMSKSSVEEEKAEPPVVNSETEPLDADVVKEKSEQTNTATTESADDSAKKTTTKLNANAKEFTFNPAAKTFTPSVGVPAPVVAPQGLIAQQMMDPNMGAPIPHIPGQQHYMHSMGHPGT
jgi:PAB1-binding protein PBP1